MPNINEISSLGKLLTKVILNKMFLLFRNKYLTFHNLCTVYRSDFQFPMKIILMV